MLMLADYRVRQRDYLLQIARALTSRLDVDEVLRLILGASLAMLNGEVGLIALRESDDRFRARASVGVPAEKLHVFKPLLESIVIDEQDGSILYDKLNLKVRLVARALDMRLRQAITLPMVMGGQILGVIFVFRSYFGEYSPDDQNILQSFADQAAIAVHNAQLYEQLSAEQQRLSAILEHSADGVLIMDAAQRVIGFNKALERITGWSQSQALGQLHDSIIYWERVEHGQPLGAALASGWASRPSTDADEPDTRYVEGDLRRRDGSRISLGVTYTALFDDDGRLQNIIANVRDITHFRRAQEAKSAFISAVSHELKTPVALIKGYASTLRREDAHWDEATVQNALAVIEDEADRLAALIEDLLAASKLRAEGMRLTHISEVDLGALIVRAAERFQTQTSKHQLIVDLPPDLPTIYGDEVRLRQVFDNLLSNAIKYSPDGGEIRITGAHDAQGVTISVSDQGVGIPPEDLPHIFERFYRVDNALSRRTQGTGLGLYLANAFVKAHGGAIRVESTPHKGSTFYVWLPRQPV
ncbi:MAG: ATP-binding protein [Aggregatilineales bacterium]